MASNSRTGGTYPVFSASWRSQLTRRPAKTLSPTSITWVGARTLVRSVGWADGGLATVSGIPARSPAMTTGLASTRPSTPPPASQGTLSSSRRRQSGDATAAATANATRANNDSVTNSSVDASIVHMRLR